MLDHLGTQAARKVDGDTMTVMSTNPIMCVYMYACVYIYIHDGDEDDGDDDPWILGVFSIRRPERPRS